MLKISLNSKERVGSFPFSVSRTILTFPWTCGVWLGACWGLEQSLIFDSSGHGSIASLHIFPTTVNAMLSWSFFLFLCVETPLYALLGMDSDPKSAINMRGYICVEMLSYLTVRFLLFWVIVTQSFIVQELESQSAIRNRHQHLLLIKQRLNATAVQKPYKSPQSVNLCLLT